MRACTCYICLVMCGIRSAGTWVPVLRSAYVLLHKRSLTPMLSKSDCVEVLHLNQLTEVPGESFGRPVAPEAFPRPSCGGAHMGRHHPMLFTIIRLDNLGVGGALQLAGMPPRLGRLLSPTPLFLGARLRKLLQMRLRWPSPTTGVTASSLC